MSEPEPPPARDEPNPQLTQPETLEPAASAAAAPEGKASKGARAPAATFIFFTVMLDMLALGMIAPVLPRLIESFLHGDTSAAARMLGLFGMTFAGMQFFCSPILGSVSDRFGRRPVVLLSNFGLGADYLMMSWAPALHWLLLGRIISGLTASSIPTAMAYMADVTPSERRAAAFGMLNAAFGVGFVLGPALGGVLGSVNPRLPFMVAAGLSLCNGMYGLFVLPESLKVSNRAPFSWRRANPIGSLVMLGRTKVIAIMSVVLLLGYTAQQSLLNVYVLYADYRYHWSDRTVGLSLGLLGVFTILYGAFLVRWAAKKFGERVCIFCGLLGGSVGYACFGLSKTGVLFVVRHSVAEPDVAYLAVGPGDHEPRDLAERAGPASRRHQRHSRRGRDRRARAVYVHLCARGGRSRDRASARAAVLYCVGAAGDRHSDQLVGDAGKAASAGGDLEGPSPPLPRLK